MARPEEWQAEIRVMDKIATAMADLDSLTEAAQARVRSRVLEIYFPSDVLPASVSGPADKFLDDPDSGGHRGRPAKDGAST